MGDGGTDPQILNLGTRRKSSSRLGRIIPGVRAPGTNWIRV